MQDQETISQQVALLEKYRARLAIQLTQMASLGLAYTPPGTINDIHDARDNIRRIKSYLRAYKHEIIDHPNDEPSADERLPKRTVPHQTPPSPPHYIERIVIEKKIQNALLAKASMPLLAVYGYSGAGKSSLVAQIARAVDNQFTDGIFWGDLTSLSPNDQFLAFLGAINNDWHRGVPHDTIPLKDIFWQRMIDHDSKALVVFDNVKDIHQAQAILPTNLGRLGRCRIIIISTHRFVGLPEHSVEYQLGYFSEKEDEAFFRKQLGVEKFKTYQEQLREISRKLEHVPQLLVAAAKEFTERNVSPVIYAFKLRQTESQALWTTGPLIDGLALIVHEMPEAYQDVFDTIGVFGEGDWSAEMLSAVTLRPLADIRQALGALIERDLVKTTSEARYHTNAIARACARERFAQRAPYVREAAFQLLARFLLDLAQDVAAELFLDLDQDSAVVSANTRVTPDLVQAFYTRLLPEMTHIHWILHWALQREYWDLLLRFASVAYLELHRRLIANSFEISKKCHMATFIEPIFWRVGDERRVQVRSFGLATEWHVHALPDDSASIERVAQDGRFEYRQAKPPGIPCELKLEAIAGHIVDGIFSDMCLIDPFWAGVRAPHLICQGVDIVGGQFLACDLSHSVWAHSDARRLHFYRSNLRFALLSYVKMRSANLRGVDLSNAVLEHVDLRGADLREANFSGALLNHVDLRDADLRGANFTAIESLEVSLQNAQIEDCCWAGANTHGLAVSDQALIKEIEESAQQSPELWRDRQSRRVRPFADLQTYRSAWVAHPAGNRQSYTEVQNDWSEMDLRAVDFNTWSFSPKHILRGADLRAANLSEAVLRGTILNRAHLRAANLRKADLRGAKLYAADLSAAVLESAQLHGTLLSKAVFRSAYLSGAILQSADLSGSQLQRAEAHCADFSRASLVGADLTHINLTDATLVWTDLREALLVYANCTNANFLDADLTGTICTSANFTNATISDKQLAQAKRLDAAILRDGRRVVVLDKEYSHDSIAQISYFRFAHLDGEFTHIHLVGKDLTGAHLDGAFVEVTFSDTDLTLARLAGHFSVVDCSARSLVGAQLHGTFHKVSFGTADLQDANIEGGSFIEVDLSRVRHLTDEQLRRAYRLHCTLLPDGMYDGRFNLAGDREAARNANVDPDDAVAMARFLADPRPRFSRRR